MGEKEVREPFLPLLPWIPPCSRQGPTRTDLGQGFLRVSWDHLEGCADLKAWESTLPRWRGPWPYRVSQAGHRSNRT